MTYATSQAPELRCVSGPFLFMIVTSLREAGLVKPTTTDGRPGRGWRPVFAVALFAAVALVAASPAHAQDAPVNVYSASAKSLFALFAIALALESALHLVFTWRPFITTFDGQAVKPLVSFAVALVVVWTSGLDIAADLVSSYLATPPGSDFPGRVLTAMILAGGSSGVNRLMQSLGIRPTSAQQAAPAPIFPANTAWLSVTVRRGDAKGPVTVLVAQSDAAAPNPAEFVLGVVPAGPNPWPMLRFFLRRRDRAPPENGHRLTPGVYAVRLVDNTGVKSAATWGPFGVAGGTLVDVDLTFMAAPPA